MDLQEARDESRRRWGVESIAYERNGRYLVGTSSDYGTKRDATGTGSSWEAAYLDAEKRAGERL
jgi:hypothetical protein